MKCEKTDKNRQKIVWYFGVRDVSWGWFPQRVQIDRVSNSGVDLVIYYYNIAGSRVEIFVRDFGTQILIYL